MKAKDLAKRLMENPEMEVMILDGFNGGGFPRTLNLGPSTKKISEADAFVTDDCEDKIDKEVLVIGFGCY